MADSQSDSNIFSIRIVSIDYYMAPPISDIDICYSSFQGRTIHEIPVIRIFGSTPAGQKTCLHIHRALPYLYVPCAEISLQPQQEVDAYTHAISLAMEKALKLKGNAASKRQHVHGCSLVRGKKLYGFHSSEELFVKIYLYYPQDVCRAANLLLDGAILDSVLQPYESHIPFLLQFLIDYNLYGMGYVHLSKIKFRPPVPAVIFSMRAKYGQYGQAMENLSSTFEANSCGDFGLVPLVWTSSTVPTGWVWNLSGEFSDLSDQGKRISTCELEGDATIDEILNQKSKLYSSLSQTCSDVKMVQSLVPIWEEEYERTGMHEMVMLRPDSVKPLPQDVLRTFFHDLLFDSKLIDICNEADNIMDLISSTDKDSNFLLSVATKQENTYEHPTPNSKDRVPLKLSMEKNNDVVPQGLLCQQDYRATDCEEKDVSPIVLPINDSQTSGRTKTSYVKAADKEAMGLLRWLVSSQAAEEMNSDDEDVGEPILSPMFPAMTIDKMLEKANMDFESESQQECQDILDSIQDFDNKGEKYSIDHKFKPEIPLEKMINQVNGSSDDQRSSQSADNMMHLQHQELQNEGTSSTSRRSLRDLMRRKRSYKFEPSECEIHRVKKVSIDDDHKENTCLCPKQLDFKSMEIGGTDRKSLESFNLMPLCNQQTDFHASRNEKPTCSSYSLYGKLPILPNSETVVQANTSKDMLFDSGERVDGSGNLSYKISPGEQESLRVVKFNEDCAVSMGHFQNIHSRESDLTAAVIRPVLHNSTTCKSNSLHDALSKKFDMENNVASNERYQEPDNVGCDILSTSLTDQKMLVGDDEIVFDSLEGADAMTNTAMPFEDGGGGPERDMCLNGPGGLVHMTKEAGELSAVTFCKKPSMLELSNWRSENFLLSPHGVSEGALDKVFPFLGVSKEKMEIPNQCFGTNESDFHQEAAMGLPTHFKNDGSYLYMLTPARSPPSADSVYKWLLSDEKGMSRANIDAASTEYSILRGCSNSLLVVESSRDGTCSKPDPSYDSVHNSNPVLDKLNNQNLGNTNAEMNFRNSKQKTPLQSEKSKVKEKDCIDCLHHISQISGPDRNSKPTPLSQIGFRDPASDGGGQQLTSISIEILAESRGDLRPDPRYDAINIIALVIEDDNDSIPVIYVLLRSSETFQRSLDGISGCKMLVSSEERQLFVHFMKIICLFDPDILLGWEIQGCSLGYLAERASYLGIGLLSIISRTPSQTDIATTYSENTEKHRLANLFPDSVIADPIEDAIIEDEWGRTHASGVRVSGRIVLNIWRLMHGEIKLKMYTLEAVSEAVLRRKIPLICNKVLKRWFLSGSGQARYKCIEYVLDRAKLNLEIINQLDMVNRTSELARVFGIDFFSVLSRGSQYRVESMLLRLAHTQNYIAISPGSQQVASQPAMECIPLVMEPESGFYGDPVLVLDFQSLYPSMIIAYNLCFCTCLGNFSPGKVGTLGISSFSPAPQVLRDVNKQILLTPNGVMYVPSKVRKGILPRLLEEILSTRIMVKQAMKKLSPSQKVLQRIFNARQLALKLIANVTYGYTAAGFSGRMPLAELADSIVQCGRLTLETAISFVNAHDKWKAKVIYGDTDSMFVLLKGRSVKEAFKIGQEIASEITAMNPDPVTLKFEKVYHPCFLLTKKRYVGYSYESPDQHEPMFDAKGIETVRRDTCEAVAKTMEQSLRLFFEHQNKIELKRYLQRQWTRILSGRVSLQDFIFAKEVRLGTYSTRTSSLPPAAIVTTKAMRADPRAEPRYGERIPYVVIHGDPGARLVDMVVDPLDLLAMESPYRLNDLYYIYKQIIPALQRVFGLVGADLNKWFLEMPRPVREAFGKRQNKALNPHKTRIDYYYLSKHCLLCGELVQASSHFCNNCSEKKTTLIAAVVGKTSKLEREIQHLTAICRHCGGGDWLIDSGVKCTSLACSVFYERRKVQKEIQGISAVATEAGFYPKCNVEWF